MDYVKYYVKPTELGPKGEMTMATLKVMLEGISNEDISLLTKQEPEPWQDFTLNIPFKFLLKNGTLDRNKASVFFSGVKYAISSYKPTELLPEGKITAATLKDFFERYINWRYSNTVIL